MKDPIEAIKFWARGYCVDTIGLDSEMVVKYVKIPRTKRKRF
jgi:putative transposase